MPILLPNSTDYEHPWEPNLADLHTAMGYNENGEPVVRTSVTGVTIEGNVNVDRVRIWDGTNNLTLELPNNDAEPGQYSAPTEAYNMVFNGASWDRMRGTTTSGILVNLSNPSVAVTQSTNPWVVTGTVSVINGQLVVSNFTSTVNVASLPAISGTVIVSNFTSTVNVASLPAISGTVMVSNFTSTVNVESLPAISGTVMVSNFTSTVQVSNNVTATITGTVSVNNFPTTSTVYQGTIPWAITGTVVTTPADPESVTLIKYADDTNMQMDATDRLRVSEAYDAWWYAPTVDKDGDYRYIESYTGTNAGSVFIQNLASVSLSSGGDAAGAITRISRRRHKMRPTISVRVSFSLNWNGYDANVTKRAGLFTNFNGAFYEVKDDLYIVLRRRLADGTLIEKRIKRENFNIDKLDGTTSAYNYAPNSAHTFETTVTSYISTTPVVVGSTTMYNVVLAVADRSIFFAGLKGRILGITPSTFDQVCMVAHVNGSDNIDHSITGPGNVTFTFAADPGVYVSMSSARFYHDCMFHQGVFGFDFNGNRNTKVRFFVNGMRGRQVVHTEQFEDLLSTPWENAPAMSTRFEVFNTAAPGYRPSLLVSSETVTIEGPPSENRAFGTAYNNTPVLFNKNLTEEYPLLGIALRPGEPYQRAALQLKTVQFTDTANINPQNSGLFFWKLLLNPTINGVLPTATNVGRASRQWAYTATNTVQAGTGIELASGYVSQNAVLDIPQDPDFVDLGSNIAYDDSDKLVLVVKMLIGGTSQESKLIAQMNFVELL